MIFGAGAWGNIAYHYCKNKYEIIAYVDNNSKLWNTSLNGIPVKSPDILINNKVMVILANLKCGKTIREQLLKKYEIECVLRFSVAVELEETGEAIENDTNEGELIVSFYGGLGNQMFAYALYRMLEDKGKKVRADLLHYYTLESRSFELTQIFPEINICKASSYNIKKYKTIAPYMRGDKSFKYYVEPSVMNDVKNFADQGLLDNGFEWGYLKGYFQTRVFAQEIEEILRREFIFCKTEDYGLKEAIHDIKAENAVSVHIRRGDYLDVSEIYGGICTKEYYQKAMKTIKARAKNPVFYFFSNDIEWVKDNFCEENAVYIESSMFDDYQDWYDMYLMSECKYNIIANSSFSWWGAWLNKNKDKIVIAPKKWVNADSMEDICPESWIRI